jgi:hypothetical protein
MNDLDTWRAADLLMKRYGSEAIIVAAKRVAALVDDGDLEECAAWVRIARAIVSLLREKPREGEAVN